MNRRRTHSPPHNKHDPIARNAAATQRWPPRPATCRTYTLMCPTPRSHHNHYDHYQAATPASTNRASTIRPATTQTPPARGSAQPVKNPSNTRKRSQSSKARQLTNCVQADVRQSRPLHATTTRRRVVAAPVVVPRAPSGRTPTTRAAKASISNFNHDNKRRNNDNNTRRRQRSVNNTEVLVVLVVFLGGVSRDS
jgi:hypothetical protein